MKDFDCLGGKSNRDNLFALQYVTIPAGRGVHAVPLFAGHALNTKAEVHSGPEAAPYVLSNRAKDHGVCIVVEALKPPGINFG